jgi:hypothetical protein
VRDQLASINNENVVVLNAKEITLRPAIDLNAIKDILVAKGVVILIKANG